MSLDLFESKDKLFKAFHEHMAKVKAIHALPEYQEFLKYRTELEHWGEFVTVKRLERMKPLMDDILGVNASLNYKKHDDTKLLELLGRVKQLESKLSIIQHKKGVSFCSSNIMDLVWEYFMKYGSPTNSDGMFDNASYIIGEYTMATYSGQGEYGYSITKPQRLF